MWLFDCLSLLYSISYQLSIITLLYPQYKYLVHIICSINMYYRWSFLTTTLPQWMQLRVYWVGLVGMTGHYVIRFHLLAQDAEMLWVPDLDPERNELAQITDPSSQAYLIDLLIELESKHHGGYKAIPSCWLDLAGCGLFWMGYWGCWERDTYFLLSLLGGSNYGPTVADMTTSLFHYVFPLEVPQPAGNRGCWLCPSIPAPLYLSVYPRVNQNFRSLHLWGTYNLT